MARLRSRSVFAGPLKMILFGGTPNDSAIRYSSPETTSARRFGRFVVGELCHVTIIVSQHPAESLAAFDLRGNLPDFVSGIDDLVFEPLVISLGVIMLQELVDSIVKRLLAEEDHSFQAFGFDASHEAFQMGT